MKDWNEVLAFALALPGAEQGQHYRQDAVKIGANGRAFVSTGREAATSFCLQLDPADVALLIATDPETFFQTPHYVGYGAVLVRYDSADPERVREAIERARDQAAAKPRARKR